MRSAPVLHSRTRQRASICFDKSASWVCIAIVGVVTSSVACSAPPTATPDGAVGPDAPSGPPPLTAPAQVNVTCAQAIAVDGKTDCEISIRYPDGSAVYQGRAGVGIHGRSSASFPKRNYAIELRQPDGSDADVDLFGMGADGDWLVGMSYLDRALLRNKLGYDLFRAMGGQAADTRYAEFTLNGDTQGVVLITERMERGKTRVAMPADDGTGNVFLVKGAEEGIASTVQHAHWEVIYPKQPGPGVATRLATAEAALKAGSAEIFNQFELDAAVDFVLLEEMMRNNDAYYLSQHLYTGANGKLYLVPWDLDLTLGQPSYNDNQLAEGWIKYRPGLVVAMARRPEFRERLVARWRELRGTLFSNIALLARIAEARNFLGAALTRNWQRWDIANVQQPGFPLYPVTSADDEYSKVSAFLTARLAWIDANIERY